MDEACIYIIKPANCGYKTKEEILSWQHLKQPHYRGKLTCHVTIHCTFFLPWRQFAGCPTHVDKGVEVSLQALVRLPLQSGQCSELGPVEGFPLRVEHHPER